MERITNNKLRQWLQLLNSKDRQKDSLALELQSALSELYCLREMLESKELIPRGCCIGGQYREKQLPEEKTKNH